MGYVTQVSAFIQDEDSSLVDLRNSDPVQQRPFLEGRTGSVEKSWILVEDEFDLNSILRELDRSETHIVLRVETRRFGKPVTIIQGLPKTGSSLEKIAHILKHRLATGGTAKEGVIVLQGDHRSRVKKELVELGFPAENVEVF